MALIEPRVPRRSCGAFPAHHVVAMLTAVLGFVAALVGNGVPHTDAGVLAVVLLLAVAVVTGWMPMLAVVSRSTS